MFFDSPIFKFEIYIELHDSVHIRDLRVPNVLLCDSLRAVPSQRFSPSSSLRAAAMERVVSRPKVQISYSLRVEQRKLPKPLSIAIRSAIIITRQ